MLIRTTRFAIPAVSCLLAGVVNVPVVQAAETAPSPDGIQWLLGDPTEMVAGTNGFERVAAGPEAWRAAVADPADPWVVFRPVKIDADRFKVLYFRLAADAGTSVQVFFSAAGEGFNEEMSCRASGLLTGKSPTLYALDLTKVPAWKGQIASLRLDIDQATKGAAVSIWAVGVGQQPIVSRAVRLRTVAVSGAFSPAIHRRSAAWQDTIVTTLDRTGSSAVTTFVKDRFTYMELYQLSKLLVRVERDGRLIDADQASDVKVEDIPGGVRASYELAGVRITSELVPLMIGRDTPAQDGAALFTGQADPPAALVIDCGQGAIENAMANQFSIDDLTMDSSADTVELKERVALLKSPNHPLIAALSATSEMTVQKSAKGGQYLRVRLPKGSGTVLVAYANEVERARQIAMTDPAVARRQVQEYCDRLLQCRVTTPVADINQAFRTAMINLEYAWVEPFGWVESINHWHALWHMQHTAAAEWLGLPERSRLCTVTHAENLMPDGAVPHLMTYLHKRRDFGGTNQYWAWQARHYWEFTADREFARKIAPALDRVIAQSYDESDPDHNLLLGWGLQIGNQEDYIATPHDGTTPSIEGINMMRTRRDLAVALDDKETAARCEGQIKLMSARLREHLWLSDLGRFAFYRDPLGPARLDGQYHTLLYPVIWDLVDPLDGWTMLRHLRDRLMGEGGEVYCSNNFPNHIIATVGTQAGLAQQPWAAWGLSAAGLRNEAWRPLAAAANWVMDTNHRGTWPEIAGEPCPAYFSPPSGLFVAATVEALFGLKVNKPEGRLAVAPAFPDDWTEASLNLPDYQSEFHRKGNVVEYVVRSREALTRHVRWSLPPGRVSEVLVDGKPAQYQVGPGVGCMFVTLDTQPSKESRIRIAYEPVDYRIKVAASVAEGDPLQVEVQGLKIEQVDDRNGVLSDVDLTQEHQLRARVRSGLLAPYRAYGRLGQLVFSRRTFFLKCSGPEKLVCWLPVDLAILPACEAAPANEMTWEDDAIVARLLVRNNAAAALRGTAWLNVAQNGYPIELDIASHTEAEVSSRIPASLVTLLSAGDNQAVLSLPTGAVLDLSLTAGKLFHAHEPLRRCQQARLQPVALPQSDLIADTDWPKLRSFRAYPHMPWAGSRPPLEALGDRGELAVPGIEGLTFRFEPRKFLPISYPLGRPSWTLSLKDRPFKKLYPPVA